MTTAICVFCGSRVGSDPAYLDAARLLGERLADAGHTLVYGGATAGLMGAVADAALARGGTVVGVIPGVIDEMELAHPGLSRLHRVDTMHQRKALMADLSQAFIALPGGLGTLEELAEILTWAQIGLHRKPCGLLNVAGFYDPLLAFFAHATAQGFMPDDQLGRLLVERDSAALIARLNAALRR